MIHNVWILYEKTHSPTRCFKIIMTWWAHHIISKRLWIVQTNHARIRPLERQCHYSVGGRSSRIWYNNIIPLRRWSGEKHTASGETVPSGGERCNIYVSSTHLPNENESSRANGSDFFRLVSPPQHSPDHTVLPVLCTDRQTLWIS